MSLVFLDTETTGLELHHDIWEVAWAYDDGPVFSTILPHSLKNADPEALEINGYWKRFPDGARAPDTRGDLMLRQLLEGATIVGANPAFDAYRLQLRWQAQPWHYRLLDIESMAYQAFGPRPDGKPMGMFDVRATITKWHDEHGIPWSVPEPDHTAAGDVRTLRSCFWALRSRTVWD